MLMETRIELFGYNFSVPFFISPAGSAIKSNAKVAELDLVRAAGDENFLYIVRSPFRPIGAAVLTLQ